jgi:beta-lactamase class A
MVFRTEQEAIPEVKPLLKKPRKKQPPKGGRWSIIIFFLLTLLAIALVYLKTNLPLFWQKITAPLIITNKQVNLRFEATPVLDQIQSLTKDLRGKYGVYVYELDDKNQYGVYQNEKFPAASLMKLPVMFLFYQEVEEGKIDPEAKYTLKENDKVLGAGILQGKSAGTVYTYRQLIEYMGQYSDNTAFKVMRRILTDQKIQQAIDDLGMTKTSLKDFETSPVDIGLFFQKLYQGRIITTEHRDELLNFLTKTAYEDWLPAGVTRGIRVAHKIGRDTGTFSDGGIVFADKPYIIVIMSKDAREIEANEVLPKISSLVWDFENK